MEEKKKKKKTGWGEMGWKYVEAELPFSLICSESIPLL